MRPSKYFETDVQLVILYEVSNHFYLKKEGF